MPATLTPFAGFGPDAMGFLEGLEADNSKAYFDDHRTTYDQQVATPLKQLVVAVGERLASGPAPGISYEPKIGRSMFRINREYNKSDLLSYRILRIHFFKNKMSIKILLLPHFLHQIDQLEASFIVGWM